ncbi:hypothetical protein MUK42_06580 [Musa troglodytarum]|nr:hypothetical protein MUK42_06580 [Musa troglodytarum]
MQRSWIITLARATLYAVTVPILKLLHQPDDTSDVAGRFRIWVIPQLFANAVNLPLQKFSQSQRKVWVMTVMAGVIPGIHILLNWILVIELGHVLSGTFSIPWQQNQTQERIRLLLDVCKLCLRKFYLELCRRGSRSRLANLSGLYGI